jgi:hypothetical protein
MSPMGAAPKNIENNPMHSRSDPANRPQLPTACAKNGRFAYPLSIASLQINHQLD